MQKIKKRKRDTIIRETNKQKGQIAHKINL